MRCVIQVICVALAAGAVACRCGEDDSSSTAELESRGVEELTTGEEVVLERKAGARPVAPDPLESVPPGNPTEPDPFDGEIDLATALEGLPGDGPVEAVFQTKLGGIKCRLFTDNAPRATAAFIGLARGKRPFWDEHGAAWVTRPFYDGLPIHTVQPGMLIQGGCPRGDGSGGPGFSTPGLESGSRPHDEAGLLSFVGTGTAEGGGSQFAFTDGPAPHLNGTNTVIGQCEPAGLIFRVARVPQRPPNRPITDVIIKAVSIQRGQSDSAGEVQ